MSDIRQELVEMIALIDEIDQRLTALDSQESLCLSAPVGDVATLRQRIVAHAQGCPTIDTSASVAELREAAAEFDVELEAPENGGECCVQ